MKPNASKIHQTIYEFCKKRFPFYTILQEYSIKVNDNGIEKVLFADIFIKEINLFIECNGEQHYKPNKFFFGGSFEFEKSKKRDEMKYDWIKKNGFILVIFRFDDKLSYESFNKIIDKKMR